MGEAEKNFQDRTAMDVLAYQRAMIAAGAKREMALATIRAKFRSMLDDIREKREYGDFTMTDEQRVQLAEMEQANREVEDQYRRETAPIKAAYGKASVKDRNEMQEQASKKAA